LVVVNVTASPQSGHSHPSASPGTEQVSLSGTAEVRSIAISRLGHRWIAISCAEMVQYFFAIASRKISASIFDRHTSSSGAGSPLQLLHAGRRDTSMPPYLARHL